MLHWGAMKKKPDQEKLTGAIVRVRMKPGDRDLIEKAAREDGRGEISEWCRRVLIPAAKKALGGAPEKRP